jgi:hypothetical protein
MIARTKLSIIMLVSVVCLGFAGSANGMNWAGKEKIRYIIDNNKTIVGCKSDGIPLPDEIAGLVGKNILEITPFCGYPEDQKELLQATFLSARTSKKAAGVIFTLCSNIEQRVKISPYDCGKQGSTFVLRLSLLRIGEPVQEWCGTRLPSVSSMNAGLDQLGRQSPSSAKSQNREDEKPLGGPLSPASMALFQDDSDSE